MKNARLCWRVTSLDALGESHFVDEGQRDIRPAQYDVMDGGRVEVHCPDENGLLTVALWLEDERGTVRARNYVNIDVHDGQPLAAVTRTPQGYALRFTPGDFSKRRVPIPLLGANGNKFVCGGSGWIEYAVSLPDGVSADAVQGLRLMFEAGASTAHNRMGWKRTWRDTGAATRRRKPASRAVKFWSASTAFRLDAPRLPDDPADARGVLSVHLYENFEFASYGSLITLQADRETAQQILAASQSGELLVRFEVPRSTSANGLNLYGARMGATPVAPTLFLDVG